MAKARKEQLAPESDILSVMPARSATAGWTWRSYASGAGRGELVSAWEALVARNRLGFLASPGWLECFIRAFAVARDDVVVHVLFSADKCLAVIPVQVRAGIMRRAAALDNEHWPYWSMAMEASMPGVAEAILEHLLGIADVVDLSGLHAGGGVHQALRRAADALGLTYESGILQKGDTCIALPLTANGSLPTLSRHLQRDLRQGRRRLEQAGDLRLEIETGGSGLETVLSECFALEARGWKGESGSPIQAFDHTLRFYRELARAAAERGALAIYQMRLDGKLIAFEYCLRHLGRIDLLKISYDPAWSRVSPGTVLRGMILEHEAERGEIRSYHLGRQSQWKLRWTEQVEPLALFRVYGRGWRGQAAWIGSRRLAGGLKRLAIIRSASKWMRSVVHALPF